MPIELRKESLAGLKALIVPNPSTLNVKQLAILDALRNQTRAWPDETRLAKLVPTQIRVTGAENMSVLPQVKKGDPSVLVCHLLSGNYLPESDSMQLLSNLTITLDDSLLPSPVISATLLTPGREAASCSIVRNGNGVSISVPSLDLWALLKLEMRESQPYVDERSPD